MGEKNEDVKVDRTQRESFLLEYAEQFIDLMLFATSFAAGWLISSAVIALLVKSYEGIYSPDEITEISGDVVWSIWVAFVCALVVSTLIMTYLSRVVKRIRARRHEIFGKWRRELKQVDENIDDELKELKVHGGKTNVTQVVKEENQALTAANDDQAQKIEMSDAP